MYFICQGYWRDDRGIKHDFEIESDRAERRFIKELVEARFPAKSVQVNLVQRKSL